MLIEPKRLKSLILRVIGGMRLLAIQVVFEPVLLRLARRRTLAVTCQRDDGGGAQVHGRVSCSAFARYFGLVYLSQEIQRAHFAEGYDWERRWNSLFGITNDMGLYSMELVRAKGPWSFLYQAFLISFGLGASSKTQMAIELESAHWLTDFYPELLAKESVFLRNRFMPTEFQHSEKIVIHLRRGIDATAPVRFMPNTELLTLLRAIEREFGKSSVRIYSNSSSDDLGVDLPPWVQVDIVSDPFAAITHMASAEVLVLAKSSMSYVAGMINEGLVISPKFWHPRLPGWVDLQSFVAQEADYRHFS